MDSFKFFVVLISGLHRIRFTLDGCPEADAILTQSAGAGKSYFARKLGAELVSRGHWTLVRGFADCVKEDIAKMLRLEVHDLEVNKHKFRRMLQGYATDFCRETFGAYYWIDRLRESVAHIQQEPGAAMPILLVPDCRHSVEVEWGRSCAPQSLLVRVVRESRGNTLEYQKMLTVRLHSSEQEISDFADASFDHVVINSREDDPQLATQCKLVADDIQRRIQELSYATEEIKS